MQVCHRWMRIRAVTNRACTSKVRSRWSILLTSKKLNEANRTLTHNAFRSSDTSPNFLISLCEELICVWNVKLHSLLSLRTNDRCGRPIIPWSVR